MIDIDSTLYDATPIIVEAASACGLKWPDVTDCWVRGEDLNVADDELMAIWDRLHGEEVVATVNPYEHAVEALNELAIRHRIDLWYLSNRNPKVQEVLTSWLHKHDFPQWDQALAVWDKHTWINRAMPNIVIDDRVKTMVHSWSLDIRVFGIRQTWNCNLRKEIEGITICQDWYELEHELDVYLAEIKELAWS